MDKQKTKSQIKNLEKLKEIVEISKFDTLQKLEKATRISKKFLDVAFISKEMLLFAKNKYGIKKNENKKTLEKRKTLWVFITPEKEILSTNAIKFEKKLSKEFNIQNDYLICIGFAATKFAKKKKIETIYADEKLGDIEDKLSHLLTKMAISSEVDNITFVLDSSRSQKGIINILPIEDLNIRYEKKDLGLMKSQIFYPSLMNCIDTLVGVYISKITHALIKETKFHYLKERLIKNESSIKNIEKLIKEKEKDINKENKLKTTEELIFMTQLAKRGEYND